MFRSNSDLPAKSVSTQMRAEEKIFGRLISKETSTAAPANSSFRVYYGGVSGAVPFTWESRPGTPKHPLSHSISLPPPLTPPPSYFSYHSDSTASRRRRRRGRCSRSNLFHSIWSKINQRSSSSHSRRMPPPSPLSSSSRSSCSSTRSSSSSVLSTPYSFMRRKQRRNWESFDDLHNGSVNDDDDDNNGGWRTPCFSFKGASTIGDVYAVGMAKKALQVLMGRGSV